MRNDQLGRASTAASGLAVLNSHGHLLAAEAVEGMTSLRLPWVPGSTFEQDTAFFLLEENGETKEIRFHDYAEIYRRPGLYELLFYDRLKCQSHEVIVAMLESAIGETSDQMNSMRVVDLGAGNGLVGEKLREAGVARVIGLDVLPEAAIAAARDRPNVYDEYLVGDLATDGQGLLNAIQRWEPNAMVCVAALGFADIGVTGFTTLFNALDPGSWVAFNIRDKFVMSGDDSGLANMIWKLVMGDSFELHAVRRYRHRYSIQGEPIFYYGVVGRKLQDVWLQSDEI